MSAECIKDKAARQGRPGGFTLIEILVVLVISVGLVITMALLFRTTAQTALLLRSGNDEWTLQTRLREQLRHLLIIPGEPPLLGERNELIFLSWLSRKDGFTGKPVIAQYRYIADDRKVYYRESEMPEWWSKPPKTSTIRTSLATAAETRMSSGIDDLDFFYIAAGASDLGVASQVNHWQETDAPRFAVLTFSRAGRLYNLYFEIRGMIARQTAQ